MRDGDLWKQERPCQVPFLPYRDCDKKQLAQLLEKYKMKYYEASALTGSNIESMFFSLIDDITLLHQARRKKNPDD